MAWFLKSERLRFRRYDRVDTDFAMMLLGDPEVMRFIGSAPVVARDAVAERLERWAQDVGDCGFFIAYTKAESIPVGHAALVVQNVEGRNEHEVGWWLARAAWGQGYATEAAAAFRDHAFGSMKLPRIIHLIAPGNDRSVAVARRIGSRFERTAVFGDRPIHVYAQSAQPAASPQTFSGAGQLRTPLRSIMDLSQTYPTSVKTKLHGIVQLARTIDKGKAKAHGNLGEYHYNCPMDAAVFSFLGIDHQALLDVIDKAKSDNEIADYVAPFIHAKSESELEAWNAEWLKSAPAPGSDSEKYFLQLRGEVAPDRTDVTAWADLLDLDEKRPVAAVVAA